jgi:hypothetical protein
MLIYITAYVVTSPFYPRNVVRVLFQPINIILRTTSEGKNASKELLEGASHLRAVRNVVICSGLPERLGGFLAGEEPAKKNTVSEG